MKILIKTTFIYLALAILPAIAKVDFKFTFEELFGNEDPQLIEHVEKQFQDASEILGSYLDHDQSVDIQVFLYDGDHYNNALKEMMGGALTPYIDVEVPGKNGFYGSIVADKIQYGIDRNNKRPDAYILYNINTIKKNNCYDEPNDDECSIIKKTIIHELIHTLGFGGKLYSDPSSELYEGEGVFSKYDYYIEDVHGNPLWKNKLLNSSCEQEPGYFAGPNTKAAFFGIRLPLPQSPGSNKPDYYHSCRSDFLSFLFVGNMMNTDNSISSETNPLSLSAIEIAILQDLGFHINTELAVQEEAFPDFCPSLHNVEDKNNMSSILYQLIEFLPEETRANIKAFVEDENKPLVLDNLFGEKKD